MEVFLLLIGVYQSKTVHKILCKAITLRRAIEKERETKSGTLSRNGGGEGEGGHCQSHFLSESSQPLLEVRYNTLCASVKTTLYKIKEKGVENAKIKIKRFLLI